MREKIREKIERISVLKGLLKSTDYKAIKYAEGDLTAEEYASTLAERRTWRAEINELQAEIKSMVAAKVTPETGVEEG